MYKYLTILIALLVFSPSVFSETSGFGKKIELDRFYYLVISNDDQDHVSISIHFGDEEENRLVEQYVVGNAVASDENIKSLELDSSNNTSEIVISVHDKTSNYGARTGIIIYKKSWWHLMKIPDEKYHLHYDDKNNIYEIEINGDLYNFSQGIFIIKE